MPITEVCSINLGGQPRLASVDVSYHGWMPKGGQVQSSHILTYIHLHCPEVVAKCDSSVASKTSAFISEYLNMSVLKCENDLEVYLGARW